MKWCTKCSVEKPFDKFYKDSQKKDGLSSRCKECITHYKVNNKEKISESLRKYRNTNRDLINEKRRLKRKVKKDEINSYKIELRNKHLEKSRKEQREYYAKNRIRIQENAKKRRLKNKEETLFKQREYQQKRIKEDSMYAFKNRIRKMIGKVITRGGYTKKSKCNNIIGCDWDFLKSHLITTFELNYGIPFNFIGWGNVSIDHLLPLSSAETEDELLKLNHWSNLQLLFLEDNISKGNKLNWDIITGEVA